MKYNDKIDADTQISTEEKIAAHLFDVYGLDEDSAGNAGRQILRIVLEEFRADLFTAS